MGGSSSTKSACQTSLWNPIELIMKSTMSNSVEKTKEVKKPSGSYDEIVIEKNDLQDRFSELFSENSTGILALPGARKGNSQKGFTKPHCTVHFVA